MTWSEERVERLKALWEDGHSASRIACMLGGVTRNAVIGKVHRLGLSGRDVAACVRRSNRRRPKLKPEPPPEPMPSPIPRGPLNITLMELEPRSCRWPTERRGGQWLFCGRQTAPGKSYCPVCDERQMPSAADRQRSITMKAKHGAPTALTSGMRGLR